MNGSFSAASVSRCVAPTTGGGTAPTSRGASAVPATPSSSSAAASSAVAAEAEAEAEEEEAEADEEEKDEVADEHVAGARG